MSIGTTTSMEWLAGPSAGVTDVLQNGSSVVDNGVARVTVPTKTSDLQNDSGFVTSSAIPTKTSDLQNDSGFITAADIPAIPTKTSELQNDSGFVTSSAIPTKTSDLQNDSGFVTAGDIRQLPASTSADSGEVLTVDSQGNPGWAPVPSPVVSGVQDVTVDGVSVVTQGVAEITMPSVPTKTSQLQNDSGFITSSSLPTVDKTYNAASTNAQSGVAVAQAIAGITPGGSGSLNYHLHLPNTENETVVNNILPTGGTQLYSTGLMYEMPSASANDVLVGGSGSYVGASGVIRVVFNGWYGDGWDLARVHLFVGDPRGTDYSGFHSINYVSAGYSSRETATIYAPFFEVPYMLGRQTLSYSSPVEIYVFFESTAGTFVVPTNKPYIIFYKFA